MIRSEAIIGLPEYEITGIEETDGYVSIRAAYRGAVMCPACGGSRLRKRDRRTRRARHESWGTRNCVLEVESRKYRCEAAACGRVFWQRLPGLLQRRRSTEPFRRSVCQKHYDGISRSRLGSRERLSHSTVERWFREHLQRLASERKSRSCPRILGIDEHFFTRKKGYATTFCDLRRRRVFDVVAGRSEKALEDYLEKLEGRERVLVVCIDLSPSYRSLVRKYFPNAKIVADRFHVIRVIGHHFLGVWKALDPAGARNRGLLSLMRRHSRNLKPEQAEKLTGYLERHPALQSIYEFKQKLCELLLHKGLNPDYCRRLAPELLAMIAQLQAAPLAEMVTLGQTLYSWREEIARMWRFTRNNAVTEGFHTKIEVLQRQAYGFRNFNNYRLRVRIMCG